MVEQENMISENSNAEAIDKISLIENLNVAQSNIPKIRAKNVVDLKKSLQQIPA